VTTQTKPTTELILDARASVFTIKDNAQTALYNLFTAEALVKADAHKAAAHQLRRAYDHMSKLRRSQTAALKNLRDAIQSLGPDV